MLPDRFAPFVASPRRAALFVDFDGTLAEIHPDPSAAVPRDEVPVILRRLAGHLGRVAVVSGRPVAYLDPLVPSEVDVVGLYGLEWRHEGRIVTLDEAERWRPLVAEVAAAATRRFGPDAVEPKGLSLTIHFRGGRADGEQVAAWVADRAVDTGLEARSARMSFELHPPVARDKGTVVAEAGEGFAAVAYLGDDVGDLPAFAALERLADRGVDAVKVAVASPEAPPELVERADLVVDGPEGAERLLAALARRLEGGPSGDRSR